MTGVLWSVFGCVGWWGMAGLLVLSGCAQPIEILKGEEEEKFELTSISPPQSLGSLWEEGNGRAYMFEDLRASRVGDIVIVKIVEQHKGSKSASTKADRDSTFDGEVGGSFFSLNNLASAMAGGTKLNMDFKNKFEGSGSTSREDTLTGTIAARVVEVMPNGDLRIQGRREVTVNSERQTMIISGIVRRIDLDTQNTVLSTAIAEAKIAYTGLGVVDDVQRPGWLVRIFGWLSPI